jgi:tRNA dimethylallyltransferase
MAMLRCIVGPTAAGKSALAMELATARGLAIISADSRHVYRAFDIGTAKPTAADRERVPHYGIDVAEPTERYSAHHWATAAAAWIDDADRQGRPSLIVGGTGLYIRALVEPLDPVPELDASRRAQLAPWLDALSAAELARWCARLDPRRAHLGRTQRLRAVETALLSGQRLSHALGMPRAVGRPVRYLVVDPGLVLAERIVHRVRSMLDAGFREEVDRLRAGVPADAPAWKASGYGAVRASRAGECTEAEAIERVIIETRQYAKRQRTWFRHQLPANAVTRIDPSAPEALRQALAWWDAAEPEGDA